MLCLLFFSAVPKFQALGKLQKKTIFAVDFCKTQKRVLEYHVKNKSNEKTSFRRLYGVWATVYSMPYRFQHC